MAATDDGIGFALTRLCGTFRRRIDLELRGLGLHVGQDQVLFRLWRKEGLSQAQLGERLGCEAPTVTNMVRRMEASGLVERRVDCDDARVVRVYLTDRGRRLEAPVREVWGRIEKSLLDGLNAEEQFLFHRLLVQARQNLK
jgi:MarR family transcriptional regulator, organic hydroperoxide resistance regulator